MGNMTTILTHGAAGGAGYFLGRKSANNKIIHHTLFSRFIPTVLFAAGIAYFAFKTPDTVENVIITSSNNNTKIEQQKNTYEYELKNKALDKGLDIFGTNTKEYEVLKDEYDSFKSRAETEREFLKNENEIQGEKLKSIESKLDSIISHKSTPSIDNRVRNDSRSYDDSRKYNRKTSSKKQTIIYRNIYADPYGMRPPVVVERRVNRVYR